MTHLQQQPFERTPSVDQDGLRPGHLAHKPADVPLEAPVDHVVTLTHGTWNGVFARCQCSFEFQVWEGDYRCPVGLLYDTYHAAQRSLDAALADELERLRGQERRDRAEWATASQIGMRG